MDVCAGRKAVTHLNKPRAAQLHQGNKMTATPMYTYLQSYDPSPLASLDLAYESAVDDSTCESLSEPSEWCSPMEGYCQPLWPGEMGVSVFLDTVPVYANENDSDSMASADVIVLRRDGDGEGDVLEGHVFVLNSHLDKEPAFSDLAMHNWTDIRNAMAFSFSSTFLSYILILYRVHSL